MSLILNNNSKRIGVLSTLKSPLLTLQINSLIKKNLKNLYVFLDAKDFSKKDYKIWKERTQGTLDSSQNALYEIKKANIPFFFVENHNSCRCVQLIKKLGVLVLINAGTPRKLDQKLINCVPHGVINVHPGVLPKYKGACCVEWSILNNDQIGNTAHFMSDKYDSGPIIEIEKYKFDKKDTYNSIRIKVYKKSITMMTRVVSSVLTKKLTALDGQVQKETKIFKPISSLQLNHVKKIIQNGTYKYAK